jgi:hypothetical protein
VIPSQRVVWRRSPIVTGNCPPTSQNLQEIRAISLQMASNGQMTGTRPEGRSRATAKKTALPVKHNPICIVIHASSRDRS